MAYSVDFSWYFDEGLYCNELRICQTRFNYVGDQGLQLYAH